MAKNEGKIFEDSIKKSIPDNVLLIRLNDSPQAFKQSKLTRFTPKNPFDYICFNSETRTLFCLELKTTSNKYMTFEDIVSAVVNIIWSPFFVIVCLVAGLLFSILTRFVQVRHFREMVKLLFKDSREQKVGISSFQAFAMTLSGRVGTGNIAAARVP